MSSGMKKMCALVATLAGTALWSASAKADTTLNISQAVRLTQSALTQVSSYNFAAASTSIRSANQMILADRFDADVEQASLSLEMALDTINDRGLTPSDKAYLGSENLNQALTSLRSSVFYQGDVVSPNGTYESLMAALRDLRQAQIQTRAFNFMAANTELRQAQANLRRSNSRDPRVLSAEREVAQALSLTLDGRLNQAQRSSLILNLVQRAINEVELVVGRVPHPLPPRPVPPRPRPVPTRYQCSARGLMHPRQVGVNGLAQLTLDAAKASALQYCRTQHNVCVVNSCWRTL